MTLSKKKKSALVPLFKKKNQMPTIWQIYTNHCEMKFQFNLKLESH